MGQCETPANIQAPNSIVDTTHCTILGCDSGYPGLKRQVSVFHQANASLHYHFNFLHFSYGARLGFSRMDDALTEWDTIPRHVIFKFHGYQFITCHSEAFISFEFYLAPFQPLLWGMFVGSAVIVIIVLSLYEKYKNINSPGPCCSWSFVLAIIFEEAGFVPMRLEKQEFFRMVAGGWILMSVVLTNCYNGLMISNLNSPLPRTNIPETFQDLICKDKKILNLYKQQADLTDWIMNTANLSRIQSLDLSDSPMCYKILSAPNLDPPFQFLQLIMVTFMKIKLLHFEIFASSSQLRLPPEPLTESISIDDIVILLLSQGYNTFSPANFNSSFPGNKRHNNMPQTNAAIINEVAKCEKSVLVVEAFDMGFRFHDMTKQYFWRKFYKGKDILNFALVGWTFEGEGNSKVPQYFQYLFESGIQERLDLEISMRKYSRNSEYTIPKREDDPVRLDGAILTLFILCGVLISSSVLIVVFELLVDGPLREIYIFKFLKFDPTHRLSRSPGQKNEVPLLYRISKFYAGFRKIWVQFLADSQVIISSDYLAAPPHYNLKVGVVKRQGQPIKVEKHFLAPVAAGSENATRYPTRYPQHYYPYPHGYPCGYPLPATRYEN
ncbi:hypothetical protein Fcan01_25357 [Folsomia candida]|uniref:Uncharacterized protein n=1 Tax=Folsomia candida TaxID=158441 RepID=A0A226D333_FOLCA|nr:hypothetical protein Fcan01_25357 [Folsomia candida]